MVIEALCLRRTLAKVSSKRVYWRGMEELMTGRPAENSDIGRTPRIQEATTGLIHFTIDSILVFLLGFDSRVLLAQMRYFAPSFQFRGKHLTVSSITTIHSRRRGHCPKAHQSTLAGRRKKWVLGSQHAPTGYDATHLASWEKAVFHSSLEMRQYLCP